MLYSKVMFLIGCIIVAATAQQNLHPSDHETKVAKRWLKTAFDRIAATTGPDFQIISFGSILRTWNDAYTLYSYKTSFTEDGGAMRVCSFDLYLYTDRPGEGKLDLQCPHESPRNFNLGNLGFPKNPTKH